MKYLERRILFYIFFCTTFLIESTSILKYEPELFPGLIYRMKQPKIVLLIFVSGKIVLTGAKVAIAVCIFLMYLIWCLSSAFFNGPPLLDSFYRLGMRRILHLRIYTLFWLSSGKINNGMFLSCKWDVFYSLVWREPVFFLFYSKFIIKQWRI